MVCGDESDRRETQTADHARSRAEYTAKIGLVAEESDESLGWLEFIQAAHLLKSDDLKRLIAEAQEICAIMSASHGTARHNERNEKPQ